MILSEISVKRPILAIVMSIFLIIFGIVSYLKLPLRELPNVDLPIVSVIVDYDGVPASVIEEEITKRIEDSLSGISGIESITASTRNGRSSISISFDLEHNILEALSDVRDAVSRTLPILPDDASEPRVIKYNIFNETIIRISLRSTELDRIQLSDYAKRYLVDGLSLLNGVGDVRIYGALEKVVYIELDLHLMVQNKISVDLIKQALSEQNIEAAAGVIQNREQFLSVRLNNSFDKIEKIKKVVIKNNNGRLVYLEDVAKVFEGVKNEESAYKSNGVQNVGLAILPQSDANPVLISQEVNQYLSDIAHNLPESIEVEIVYDKSIFIERAFDDIIYTFLIALILVSLVLYLFLSTISLSMLPILTVPISLIATFIVMYFFQYSLNILTLLALVLSIGLVVDDTIVVVENIFRNIQKGYSVLISAFIGVKEVGFAVIATTLVIVIILLPVVFVGGVTGKFLIEFSVTLATAIIFSTFIALTFTPALASFLKINKEEKISFMSQFLFFIEKIYVRILNYIFQYRFIPIIIIVFFIGLISFLLPKINAVLTPTEDRGIVFIWAEGKEGEAYDSFYRSMETIEQAILPLTAEDKPLKSILFFTPASWSGRTETGFFILSLKDWSMREESVSDVTRMINEKLNNISQVKTYAFTPGFRGGSSDPIQFVLLGSDHEELHHYSQLIIEQLNDSEIIAELQSNYTEEVPELSIMVNNNLASRLGVSPRNIASTLDVLLKGTTHTTYSEKGELYDLFLRGNMESFQFPSDINKIYVLNNDNEMINVSNLIEIIEQGVPEKLNRYQRANAITLSGQVREGHNLGEALDVLEDVAQSVLPSYITYTFSGESKDLKESNQEIIFVFVLAFFIAYLALCAQFESFINPLIIMVSVPLGVAGGLLGLYFTGSTFDIYSQIGTILLIGMVTKNGILIVEFINQLRDKGIEFNEAIIQASKQRLRPIIMTTLTTLLGAIPLLLATGPGSEARNSIGIIVFFGLFISTLVTVFLVPMMYLLIGYYAKPPDYRMKKLSEEYQKNVYKF